MAVKWKWKPAAGGSVSPELTNKVQQLETNYNNLNTQAVKISGDQSIAGVKTFTNSGGEVIKLNSGTNNSAYIAGYKSGNTRIWYFGKGSSTDDNFVIGSTADIKLQANSIHCNNKKLTNVADPTADQDAANKRYVDNRIKTRTLNQNIGVGTTASFDPTSGYQIVSFQVARKRNSDSFYFFTHNINLNFQAFMKNNTQYAVYNNGTVNDFSNDFRIVILEMKV